MTYELAKKLKDAGFVQGMGNYFLKAPHEIKHTKDPYREFHISEPQGYENLLIAGYDMVYAPTLKKLIEECGDDFEALTMEHSHAGNQWNAMEFHGNKHGQGNTPEGAVAMLWIELNKKT